MACRCQEVNLTYQHLEYEEPNEKNAVIIQSPNTDTEPWPAAPKAILPTSRPKTRKAVPATRRSKFETGRACTKTSRGSWSRVHPMARRDALGKPTVVVFNNPGYPATLQTWRKIMGALETTSHRIHVDSEPGLVTDL
ncbi:hypothetical protein VTO42DRAFT_4765 [Malbranchea cinnamomea]